MKKGIRKLVAFMMSIAAFTAIVLTVNGIDVGNLGFAIASINLTFSAPNMMEHWQKK